jgi:hypothetical protein
MKVANSIIIAELEKFLGDTDFFALYPTRASLQAYLRDAVSDGDKIRAILRDEYVQRELFPDWQSGGEPLLDPLQYYLQIRKRY